MTEGSRAMLVQSVGTHYKSILLPSVRLDNTGTLMALAPPRNGLLHSNATEHALWE